MSNQTPIHKKILQPCNDVYVKPCSDGSKLRVIAWAEIKAH